MKSIKKIISVVLICFVLVTLIPLSALGEENAPSDIKWTFQNGNVAEYDGYNTTYLKGYSTKNEFNMTSYVPGAGYRNATDVWAVYDIPVSVSGTYQLYVNFGSSDSMSTTNMDDAIAADFKVTTGGMWNEETQSYEGGSEAFENVGITGGIWGTVATAPMNCKMTPVGYLTLSQGINPIKIDIKSYDNINTFYVGMFCSQFSNDFMAQVIKLTFTTKIKSANLFFCD